jgi:hypothetical protein
MAKKDYTRANSNKFHGFVQIGTDDKFVVISVKTTDYDGTQVSGCFSNVIDKSNPDNVFTNGFHCLRVVGNELQPYDMPRTTVCGVFADKHLFGESESKSPLFIQTADNRKFGATTEEGFAFSLCDDATGKLAKADVSWTLFTIKSIDAKFSRKNGKIKAFGLEISEKEVNDYFQRLLYPEKKEGAE